MQDIVFQAERVAAFDRVKRYVVKTAERFPNGNRVPAIRLALRDGDDVAHVTENGERHYDEAVALEGVEAVHGRLAR